MHRPTAGVAVCRFVSSTCCGALARRGGMRRRATISSGALARTAAQSYRTGADLSSAQEWPEYPHVFGRSKSDFVWPKYARRNDSITTIRMLPCGFEDERNERNADASRVDGRVAQEQKTQKVFILPGPPRLAGKSRPRKTSEGSKEFRAGRRPGRAGERQGPGVE